MDSIIPFIDLNLAPDNTITTTTSTSNTTGNPSFLTPKLEVKPEPLDGPSFQRSLVYREEPPPTESSFRVPDSQNNPVLQLPSATTASRETTVSTSEENIYSEYYRISELFRAAFSNQYESYDDDAEVVEPDCRAIVPVPEENQLSTSVVAPRRRQKCVKELVRVANLSIEDERHYRNVVRKTRMVYDSLRLFIMAEEEKQRGDDLGRRGRWDMRAASVMRGCGMWLHRDKRIVGAIPGIQIGDIFFFRMELCMVGLHGQIQAGIDYLPTSQSSSKEPIATSIIVSGGYEDDEDAGDVLIYTGQGGQDKLSRQCEHQKLEGGNLALERSMYYGIEVRVIRGFKYANSIGSKVYVYDGLYKIVDYWFDVGKSGFGVYKFKILRAEGQGEMGSAIMKYAHAVRNGPLAVRPRGYLSFDISNKKEKMPVFLYNDIDYNNDPLCYEYLEKVVFPPSAFNRGSTMTGCKCISSCSDDCACTMKNGGEFAYDSNGILVRGKPVIFECGVLCRCPPSCRNRVTQNGLRNRLEVFRSRETGWGVRSLDLIQAGSFICEYAGVALSREQAQIFTMNGDTLVYPNQFAERWSEWGDLSNIFADYVRPTIPSIPPLDFAMDISRMRNVACYISHCSTPNLLVQYVLYDHNNYMFPHLMLFAMENIPPLRELSLDYGVANEWTGKLPICN